MDQTMTAALKFAKEGSLQILKSMKAVPDDKMGWKPSPTAKNVVQICAHAGVANLQLANIIRNGKSEFDKIEEYVKFTHAEEEKIQTREQAIQCIETSVGQLEKALLHLSSAQLAKEAITPFGACPMSELIYWPGNHLYMHASQIDYIQTIWGDMEIHM